MLMSVYYDTAKHSTYQNCALVSPILMRCVCVCVCVCVGSGKSFTMMGSVDQPGLIPRLCSSLFDRTLKEKREEECFTVEVSYMEIYNEKVRDLLDPKG